MRSAGLQLQESGFRSLRTGSRATTRASIMWVQEEREREREPESTSRISYFSGLAVHTQAFTVVVRLVAWTGIQELEGFGEPRRGDGTYGIVGCLRALNLRRSLIHKTRDVVVASVGPVLQEWGERARTVLRASYPELSSLSLRREP